MYICRRPKGAEKLKNGVPQLVEAEIIPLNLIRVMPAEERAIFKILFPVFCFLTLK